MPTQTIYPALLPLWQEMQTTISSVQAQASRRNEPPRVSFIGRFKTGKSRLINALIETEDILPYNTDECTAQLVELAYGDADKATQLAGLDLDSSSEHPIELSEFREAVDMTARHGNKNRMAEAAAFRRYLPSPFLKTIRIVDTPGFDGTNQAAKERAEQVRESAIRQASLCVLVLSAGLSTDDLQCVRLTQQHGKPVVLILNQADKYDAEDRQDMQRQILEDIGREAGIQPAFYACSALWQGGSEQDKAEIQHQRRYFDEEEEHEWHQWEAFVKRLSRPVRGENHIAILKTIHAAFDFAMQVYQNYDQTQQAEAVFLEHLPQWRRMTSSLIGQTVLEIAVSAAHSGKPLPWKRLENFGITPSIVASEQILPMRELKQMTELYRQVLVEVKQLALNEHHIPSYRFLTSDVSAFTFVLEKNIQDTSGLVPLLKSSKEDALWYSQPWRKDFTYPAALSGLQRRWDTQPNVMDEDCTRIRQRLAAALA